MALLRFRRTSHPADTGVDVGDKRLAAGFLRRYDFCCSARSIGVFRRRVIGRIFLDAFLDILQRA